MFMQQSLTQYQAFSQLLTKMGSFLEKLAMGCCQNCSRTGLLYLFASSWWLWQFTGISWLTSLKNKSCFNGCKGK
jgi:hypothetical protein